MTIGNGGRRIVHVPRLVPVLGLALLAAWALPGQDAQAKGRSSRNWKKLAKTLAKATKLEQKADYLLALGRASLLEDEEDRDEAIDEAKEDYRDEKSLAKDQFRARLELADDLGEEEIYTHEVDPADFVEGVNHPYLPLVPGNTWTYEGETEDGTETTVVTVLGETREILGVECTVVRDTVSIDGELVEDTHDWFAQDTQGNVWYFGEISLNYEDGRLVDVEGSWEAGADGAQPGIVMPGAPATGMLYRQEFYAGEAEDFAEILSLDASASVPFGDFENCIETFDGTPMEPDVEEHKFYAPGIGVVLEVDLESGERNELISFSSE